MSMGSIEYMAPEQYRDAKNVNHQVDIYALGKLLYEVLTGEIPYPEMDFSKVPKKFIYVIQKACEKDLSRRYSAIKQFIADLDLVTEGEKFLTKPAEIIRKEIKEIMEQEDFRKKRIEGLARLILENIDDNTVLNNLLPKIPDPVLKKLFKYNASIMSTILKAFDESVTGHLPFEYCDVVADFYETVFHLVESEDIRTMILRRLPQIAYYHSRWHVAQVFARLVGELKDASSIMVVREVLKEDEKLADWCKIYLEEYSLPSAIKGVFKSKNPESE